MDAQHFDALVRAIGNSASRRRLLAGLGGLLPLVSEWSWDAIAAKKGKKGKGKKGKKGKKHKPKKPAQCKASQVTCGKACCDASQACVAGQCLDECQLVEVVTQTESRLVVAADCAVTATIVVPDGFTLDGNGHTIHMAGPVSGYQSVTVAGTAVRAGVLIQDGAGSVKNLTIDQDGLECGGAQAHSAIVMAKGRGDIESVDIVVTQGDLQCYRGIDAEVAAANNAVNVRSVSITGGRSRAMAISGPTPADGLSLVAGEIRDTTIEDALFGMLLNATKHQVTGNEVTAKFGILIGVFPSNVFIDDNTISGLAGSTNPSGILFNADTKGTVSNNTISGFTCGISIQVGGGPVTGADTNTFSDNTTNVCNVCGTDGDCDDRATSCQDGVCQAVCPAAVCSGCPICVTHLQTDEERPPLCANQLIQVAPDTCATDADCTGNEDDVCVRVSTGSCTQSPCGICVSANVCA